MNIQLIPPASTRPPGKSSPSPRRTLPREIAACVTESSRRSFAAEMFHFGASPRELEAGLFLLAPGEYEMTVTEAGAANGPHLQRRAFRVESPRVRVVLQLPSRRLCAMKVGPRQL